MVAIKEDYFVTDEHSTAMRGVVSWPRHRVQGYGIENGTFNLKCFILESYFSIQVKTLHMSKE